MTEASQITSGTLAHERGGLEANVSAYNGLVKISGGKTSQAVPGTYAKAAHNHTQARSRASRPPNPQFTAIKLGRATDTTLARSAAGQVTIESVQVLPISDEVGGQDADRLDHQHSGGRHPRLQCQQREHGHARDGRP